ncbi:Tannase/feruloyl esterase [Leptodontidium sp. 2 PMI_412]|nr:Tannase/feruloyl esterase [Leptodontidium sp. 2 PMI_412]
MAPAVADGFAVATTDGGHTITDHLGYDDAKWGLKSPGNVDWYTFLDFAYVGLHDMARIGKFATEPYYGTPPSRSYFYGASTGGRQGLMFAQKYPKDFDGIVSIFPAINWARFILSNIWPQFVMNRLGVYPPGCELDAFTNAAISACDQLDGVIDGIISLPGLCTFDPHVVVGKSFDCDGIESVFTSAGADVAEAAWSGPRSSTGEFQWYGLSKDATLGSAGIGVATTSCQKDGTCKGVPFVISTSWVKYWLTKDPDFDISKITHEEWDELQNASITEFQSAIDTADPDLSQFRKTGGKILAWHGLIDPVISPNGTTDYYDKVLALDPKAHDFFRLFLVPGGAHSFAEGPTPKNLLNTTIKWVEEGEGPETLHGDGKTRYGEEIERILCMYPKIQVYRSGDPTPASSFECA